MKNILQQLSKNAIELNPDFYGDVEKQQQWIGREPCCNEAIQLIEKRLKVSLPNDVKEFYSISNGTSVVLNQTFGAFMPIEQIDWLVNIQKETLVDYGEMPESYLLDLQNAIIISGLNYVHQVFIIQPYGEFKDWKYWEFASYIPGENVFNGITSYLERLNDFLIEQIKNRNETKGIN